MKEGIWVAGRRRGAGKFLSLFYFPTLLRHTILVNIVGDDREMTETAPNNAQGVNVYERHHSYSVQMVEHKGQAPTK